MGLFVALFLAGKFVLYCGFFFLLSKLLDIGTPVDALRAGMHRTWLGGAATMIVLVVYMFLHMGGVSPAANRLVGTVVIWLLRLAVWTFVATQVYRVTRWRKGKLAILVLAGLTLNFAVDFGLDRLQGRNGGFMPSLGDWEFRLC
jgi:hypothetical protein